MVLSWSWRPEKMLGHLCLRCTRRIGGCLLAESSGLSAMTVESYHIHISYIIHHTSYIIYHIYVYIYIYVYVCIIYHIRIWFIFLPANGTLTKYFLDSVHDSVLFTEALKSNFVGKLTLASTKHQASSIKFCSQMAWNVQWSASNQQMAKWPSIAKFCLRLILPKRLVSWLVSATTSQLMHRSDCSPVYDWCKSQRRSADGGWRLSSRSLLVCTYSAQVEQWGNGMVESIDDYDSMSFIFFAGTKELRLHQVHWGTLCTSCIPFRLSIWARDLSHLKPSRCSALVYLIKKCSPSSTQSTAFILHLIIIKKNSLFWDQAMEPKTSHDMLGMIELISCNIM